MEFNAPIPSSPQPRDEVGECLDLITKRLLPVVIRRLVSVETAVADLRKAVSEIPAPASAAPASEAPAEAPSADMAALAEQVSVMAHNMTVLANAVDELDRRTQPKKRTSANVIAKFNRLTASDVAMANHVLRQTSSAESASRFTGIPLPVVRHIASLTPEDYRQHVLHKRTPSESNPPEGLTEDDFQTHWTVPLGDSPDSGTDDILPDSAVGEDDGGE